MVSLFSCLATLTASQALAAVPDVTTLLRDMRTSLEPGGNSLRTMILKVSGRDGDAAPITLRQARATTGDTRRICTVVIAPAEAAGTTLLLSEHENAPEERWLYAPVVRRTRQIAPVLRQEPFLNSDFTFADLGFMDQRRDESSKLIPPSESSAGVYGVEETLQDQTLYSRIVNWIDLEAKLPRRREFFDRAGHLWKVEKFEDVRTIDGIPTPMRVTMEDVQDGGKSELVTTEVRRDVELPAALFDPNRLSAVAGEPVWTAAAPSTSAGSSGS
jgi:hypothetical protein